MPDLTTIIGLTASILTAASYIPQLAKAWHSGETGDISLRMMLILLSGLLLWIVYGLRQGDMVIVAANSVSSALLTAILAIKLSGHRTQHR